MSMREIWDMQRFVESNFDARNLRLVEELLFLWGDMEIGFKGVRGYQPSDSTCREAHSNVQHDSASDVLEARSRGRMAAEVGACVESLPPAEQFAIRSIYANNSGPAVWQLGRLRGLSRDAIKQLHLSAVTRLLPWLKRRGLGFE